MNEDCVFCQILAGNMPGEIVYEDEHSVAFMDIFPWTRGHAVVVPRTHSKNLYEIPDEDLANTVTAAKRLAERMRDRLGLRRSEPTQLLRARRLADDLPLSLARDPALRERPAGAADAAPARASRRSSPRSPQRSAAELVFALRECAEEDWLSWVV